MFSFLGSSKAENEGSNGSSEFIVGAPTCSAHIDAQSFLEGNLKVRKGRSTGNGSLRWKERFVHLRFDDGGSLLVYDQETTVSESTNPYEHNDGDAQLVIHIPSDLPWVAKDVNKTTSTFVIEIPTSDSDGLANDNDDDFSVQQSATISSSALDESSVMEGEGNAADTLNDELATARQRGKPLRVYFQCQKGGNEKALWLESFGLIDRFSGVTRRSSGLRSVWANGVRLVHPYRGRARKRQHEVEYFDRGCPEMSNRSSDLDEQDIDESAKNISARINQMVYGRPMKRNEAREFKVLPGYAYPHRWMSIRELHREMMLPSSQFVDLRDPNEPSLGHLSVEVLQCIGLPRLDRASDTDGVVYLVMGDCAMATDVIPDRTNPIWLPKTRRACIFPVHHGYARLYVGVFDDDGERAKDDFAGRVVLNISKLRPNSTYDVILPLKMANHAYSRRQRGAVRLRFTLNWKKETDVLLSYFPKKWKFVPPMRSKPDLSTTIPCADHKAFRNVAITVHGVDMPGHFSFTKTKALIKEITFTIRYIISAIRQEIKDTKAWMNPAISCYIWVAWMHCISHDSFALVPGYVALYLLLQLVRNYALFLVEGPMTEGFLPPTWEEMFEMLITPSSRNTIEPLMLQRVSSPSTSTSTSSLHSYGSSSFMSTEYNTDDVIVKTHSPKGVWLFKILGFIPWDAELRAKKNLHMEFPFADGNVYEPYTLRDCLADTRPAEEDTEDHDDDEMESEFEKSARLSVTDTAKENSMTTLSNMMTTISHQNWSGSFAESETKGTSGSMRLGGEEIGEDDEVDVDDGSTSSEDDAVPFEISAVQKLQQSAEESGEGLAPLPVRKEQDMDWRKPGGRDEKITDSMSRISNKMHAITWHTFHDHVYDIKNPDSVYFNEAQYIDKRRNKNKKKHLDKKLNKLLGIHEYSNSRPIISRVGLLIEPIIGAIYGFLCGARAGFNLVTWQDPYLTFLLSLALAVATFVLFVLPWRPVLFVIGMLFVGPQNFVIRILREKGILPPRKPRQRKEEPKPKDDRKPFHSHKRVEGIVAPTEPPPAEPLEVQHIVVPYNPFMYQRMYDWPPEKQYADVKPVDVPAKLMRHDSDSLRLNSNSPSRRTIGGSTTTQKTPKTRFPRLQKLRRRHRRGGSENGTELGRLEEENETDVNDS